MRIASSGFTIMELIFVIVIIGILAAVALPKLTATRDDAKVASTLMRIGDIINEITTYATSKATTQNDLSKMSNTLSNMVSSDSADLNVTDRSAIVKMGGVECVKLKVVHTSTNDDLNVSLINTTDDLCKYLQDKVQSNLYKIRLRGAKVSF